MKDARILVPFILLAIPMALKAQSPSPIYSYTVPAGGYTANSNVAIFTDSVMGTWTMGYDNLNRIQSAGASAGPYQNVNLQWTYDSFGNRTSQTPSGISSATLPSASSGTFDGNNRLTNTSVGIAPVYDASGNMTFDGVATHAAFDADNRVCATYSTNGSSAVTQYIYDAEGHRVAKGTPINNPTNGLFCPTDMSNFTVTATYVLGPSGEQMTEVDGAGNWKHTNVYNGDQLLATYDTNGLHFPQVDPLGTVRVQASATGAVEESCASLPFGDGLTCTPRISEPTEHHFTGKERDTESGLDNFGARYYSSSMGRMMSPDPSGLALADITNPQSFNLYSYVLNNPLSFVDPNGLECVWDDGSFDSADDKQTGSHGGCSAQGGTYVDPKAFSTLGAGDWSNKANSDIAGVANALNGSNNFTNVSVNANGSGYIDQTAMALSGGIPYIVKNDYSWSGDRSLALATGVMSQGIPKICSVGVTAQLRKNSVGVSASGSGVGATANGHSSSGYTPQAGGVDMRSASPLFKTVPVGVYLSPSDPSGNSVSSVSADGTVKKVGVTAYVNLGTYTPNLSDPQNCP